MENDTKGKIKIAVIAGIISGLVVWIGTSFLSLGLEIAGLKIEGPAPIRLFDPIDLKIVPFNSYYRNGVFDTDFQTYYKIQINNSSLEEEGTFELELNVSSELRLISFESPDFAKAADKKGASWLKKGRTKIENPFYLIVRIPPRGCEYTCIIGFEHEERFPSKNDFKIKLIHKTGIYEGK